VAYPTPNIDKAQAFLQRFSPTGEVTFQTYYDKRPGDPEGPDGLARIRHGTVTQHVAEFLKLQSQRVGVWFCVNETDFQGRSEKNITRVRAVFVDTDGAPLEPIVTGPLEPHIVVETSPGKYHVYWLVAGIPLHDFRTLQKALAARFGTDASICDLPRVERVPGFYHQKDPDNPFLVRIVSDTGRAPYDAGAIYDAFAPESFSEFDYTGYESIAGPDDIAKLYEHEGKVYSSDHPQFDPAVTRHGFLNSWAGNLHTTGITFEEFSAELQKINQERCVPPWDEKKLRRLIRSRWKDKPREEPKKKEEPKDLAAKLEGVGKTFAEIVESDLPPVEWVIPNVVPAGFTLLGAKPKIGKSWLALQLALSVAECQPFFGHTPEKTSEVLYLDLEQNDILLQERLRLFGATSKRVRVINSTQKIWGDDTHNLVVLDALLEKYPDVGLVIIDPIKYLLREADFNVYTDVSNALQKMNLLKEKHGVNLFVVHHAKKSTQVEDPLDLFNGSIALAGGADTPMTMNQWHGKTFLYSRGRMAPPLSWGVEQNPDTLRWEYLGPEEEVRASSTESAILNVLKDANGEPLSPKDIGDIIDAKAGTVRVAIFRMMGRGMTCIAKGSRNGQYVYIGEDEDL
jgi:hypothetical protein